MASVTINNQAVFAVGTTVYAFLVEGAAPQPASGAPPGPVVAFDDVAEDGTLTLTGLAEKRTYRLYSPSPDRYLLVNTSASSSSGGGGDGITAVATVGDLPEAPDGNPVYLVLGEGDLGLYAWSGSEWVAVAGAGAVTFDSLAPDLVASIKGVVTPDESERPGFASVEWLKPSDPGEGAEDGDTWVPTV